MKRRWTARAAGLLVGWTLLLLPTACVETARPGPGPQTAAHAPAASLVPFFEDLDKLESQQRSEPVRVVMLGDSHTAGDDFSGQLRSLLQARFGDAGRGFLPAGRPFKYYEPRGVEVVQSKGWEGFSSLSRKTEGFYGLAGYRIEATKANEEMTLTSVTGFDHAALTLLRQPNGGRIEVSVDGQVVALLDTAGGYPEAERVELPVPPASRQLTVRTLDKKPVALLDWTVEAARPGVVLDNDGVIGASINIFDRMDAETWRAQLALRRPDLVIIAFGTNEGFDNDWTAEGYRALFRDELKQIRAAAPGAAIAIIGPPDGNRHLRGCADDEPFNDICAPLTPAELQSYSDILALKKPQGSVCRWHPPPNLEVVRLVQREVAAAERLFFWDWSELMGGACGMHAWFLKDPPLAWKDHVHLRDEGYEYSARVFFDLLMQQYAGWRAGAARS